MQTTWCIYIDESGVNEDNPEFIYAAICVPFNNQQEFLESYPKIVNPLVPISGKEIKYGPLLNNFDRNYREEIGEVCQALLTRFFKIEGAQIIRVKAIRKRMRLKGGDLRVALFRKTLELCKNSLPQEHQTMILHDELDGRDQQRVLLDTFSNKDLNFQNCVFVHSNENPLIQFADFVASICYRYYYFQRTEEYKRKEYKYKKFCASLVNTLFNEIDERCPSIVELSEHTVVKDNPRRKQALQLAEEYDIDPSTAYNIVDGNITLTEALRRKRAQTSEQQRRTRRERAPSQRVSRQFKPIEGEEETVMAGLLKKEIGRSNAIATAESKADTETAETPETSENSEMAEAQTGADADTAEDAESTEN